MQNYSFGMIVFPGKLTVSPKSECVASVGGWFPPLDEHPDRFQWEHASSHAAFGPVNGYLLFRGVVANTVELRFSAKLFEWCGVVLVCSHV